MALIRRFEQLAYRAYEQGDIQGTVHVSIGQEAVATGVIGALQPGDKVLSHHRGHGHALAKGVNPARLMAELCGRRDGVSGGKGGSMHITDSANGFLGTVAVVGGSIPLAAGVGLSSKIQGKGLVCVVFFGDGAVNQGILYETLNLSSLWQLPVVFVCENNSYAITMASADAIAGPGLVARASAFGVTAETVDGQDVLAVLEAATRLVQGARVGSPALLECLTYRYMGHSRGDPPYGPYRTKEELDEWRARDPLEILARTAGIDGAQREELDRRARHVAEDALSSAMNSERPDPAAAMEDVWG